jgi:hypothetical protein
MRGARGDTKNVMDADQSSSEVLEITPFVPLTLRGKDKGTIVILKVPLLGKRGKGSYEE